jgi:hypothetical protein
MYGLGLTMTLQMVGGLRVCRRPRLGHCCRRLTASSNHSVPPRPPDAAALHRSGRSGGKGLHVCYGPLLWRPGACVAPSRRRPPVVCPLCAFSLAERCCRGSSAAQPCCCLCPAAGPAGVRVPGVQQEEHLRLRHLALLLRLVSLGTPTPPRARVHWPAWRWPQSGCTACAMLPPQCPGAAIGMCAET